MSTYLAIVKKRLARSLPLTEDEREREVLYKEEIVDEFNVSKSTSDTNLNSRSDTNLRVFNSTSSSSLRKVKTFFSCDRI